MKIEKSICKSESCILIEGPASGDAEFNGHWLLSTAKADELLQQAKRDDSQFCKAITDLEESEFMDFGLSAEWFLSQLAANKGFQTFVIEACSANAFVIMAETGFFALTGDHYQMTLPSNLDMGRVKQACYAVFTSDKISAFAARQDQRIIHRRALLFLDEEMTIAEWVQ
jgi:hypothetical protein